MTPPDPTEDSETGPRPDDGLSLTRQFGNERARHRFVRSRFLASFVAGAGSALWFAALGITGVAEPHIATAACVTILAFCALFIGLISNPRLRSSRDRGLQSSQLACAVATVLVSAHFLEPDIRLASLFWVGSAFAFVSHHLEPARLRQHAGVILAASAFSTIAYAGTRPDQAAAAWLGWLALSAFIILLANVAAIAGGYRRSTFHSRAVAEIALASISEAVLILDPKRRIRSMNPAATRLLGGGGRRLEGRRFDEAVSLSPLTTDEVASVAPSFQQSPGPDVWSGCESGHYRLAIAEGRECEVECVRAALRTPSGLELGEVVLLRDVGATNRLMRRLEHESRHDALTGLLNRSGFLQQLHRRLEAEPPVNEGCMPHLLVIDLDEFKLVNDSCGHGAGDQLLREIGSVITGQAGAGAVVARLGGDEFAVLFGEVTDAEGRMLARALLAAIDRFRFYRDQQVFRVRASGGLAPLDAVDRDLPGAIDRAMANADAACYLAKELGRNRLHAFTSGDDELARKRRDMSWVQEIRQALEQGRFVLMGQRISTPAQAAASAAQVVARPGDPVEIEVLLRLIGRDGGLVAPGAFLPAAERFGLMKDIDRYVVREAVAMLARARAAGATGVRLSINLSAASLQDNDLPELVGRELSLARVPGAALCFEITETAAITNLASARAIIAGLRRHGCQLALDDVGTGFSSFGYLKALDVDRLKIDGSFVKAIGDEPVDRIMVESLYQIARAVGIETVAEMVESPMLIEQVSAIGIDYLQGFAIHRPEPLDGLLGISRETSGPGEAGSARPVAGPHPSTRIAKADLGLLV